MNYLFLLARLSVYVSATLGLCRSVPVHLSLLQLPAVPLKKNDPLCDFLGGSLVERGVGSISGQGNLWPKTKT